MARLRQFKEIIVGESERFFRRRIQHTASPRLALEQWLDQLKNLPPVRGRILITALRNRTWIEWAVYCATVVRQMGYETTLLYKGSEVNRFYDGPAYFNFWKGVGKIPGIQMADLEMLPYDDVVRQHYFDTCRKDTVAALAYDLHLESADIEDDTARYGTDLLSLSEESARNGARLNKLCATGAFHEFICYSGLIRDTATILRGATDAGQHSVCVEGWGWRKGHMIYNFNGPSLEYNVKGWMRYFGKWDEKKDKEMADYFSFLNGETQDEEWLKNFHNVQQAKLSQDLPEHVAQFAKGNEKVFLLACNVIGDSSLLNRETIFKSHRDFVEQTVRFFSTRPDLKLIIRAHPGEGWVESKVVIKMADFANKLTAGIDNILVISDTEKLNTFSLLPFTHAGLVWITSAGVDMVVRGVPVIAAANPKYAGLGIVDEPVSAENFFETIADYAKREVRPTLTQIQNAREYLYLVFKGFSFEAQGRNFRATTCRLNDMPMQEEHDRFYRILLREEPAPDLIYK